MQNKVWSRARVHGLSCKEPVIETFIVYTATLGEINPDVAPTYILIRRYGKCMYVVHVQSRMPSHNHAYIYPCILPPLPL